MIEFLSEYLNFQELIIEIALGFLLMGIALLFPFRNILADPEIGWDIIGLVCVNLFTIIYSSIEYPVYDWLANMNEISRWHQSIGGMPWWILVPVNFVLADCAVYWAHRLLHFRCLWPTHAWHHAPKHLYWLSGLRGSMIHTVVIIMPFTIIYLFIPTPDTAIITTTIMTVHIINQHYLHTNIRFPYQKQLELILVTPRFHFVHHSSTKVRTDSNYGFVFSCWDRLFGTYTDPDTVNKNDPLGLDYEISNIRLILGIPAKKFLKSANQSIERNL